MLICYVAIPLTGGELGMFRALRVIYRSCWDIVMMNVYKV